MTSRDDQESFSLKERDLKQHLQSELSKIDGNTTVTSTESNATDANSTQADKDIITEEKLYDDAQLKSAVDILKVLMLTQKGKK